VSVLIADDEMGMRETLTDILSQSGYDVHEAADGEAALEAIRRDSFDVVVMDVRMPGRDGVSILRELGSPPPAVILMTAYASERQLDDARRANAFAVLRKPFPVPQLLGLVASAVEAAR
jgi:CheY-like chemotaxis protein